MNIRLGQISISLALLIMLSLPVRSQPTVGVFHRTGHQDGYVLFAPGITAPPILIDKWPPGAFVAEAYIPGQSGVFAQDGAIIRAGSLGNAELSPRWVWENYRKIVWDGRRPRRRTRIADSMQCFSIMTSIRCRNGNVFAAVWGCAIAGRGNSGRA